MRCLLRGDWSILGLDAGWRGVKGLETGKGTAGAVPSFTGAKASLFIARVFGTAKGRALTLLVSAVLWCRQERKADPSTHHPQAEDYAWAPFAQDDTSWRGEL